MRLILTWGALLLLSAWVLLQLTCPPPPPANSQVVTAADGALLYVAPAPDGRLRIGADLSRIDPLYLKFLIAGEDRRYYEHPGVDVRAIVRALIDDVTAGRLVSGGSTIAMQLARARHGHPRRNVFNKLREALGAIQLDFSLGKKGVLEDYLTLVPMGGNLEGVECGARFWFGHDASHLTPAEAALLVALPRAPERLRPDRHPERARLYRNRLLKLLTRQGVLAPDIAEAAMAEPLPARLLPNLAPAYTLGRNLVRQIPMERIVTTLDARIQKEVNLVSAAFDRSAPPGLSLAIVVLDGENSRILGYSGTASARRSELDLAAAVRSPGSALKPFAYTLAMERALIHPATVLSDRATYHGGWSPRNYSGMHLGEITAGEALCISLNEPAVQLTEAVGPQDLMARLNAGRERVHLPKGSAVTSAFILGGCGITLRDLTALHAALHRDGHFVEPQLLAAAAAADGRELFAPGAARATSEILQKTPRPEGFADRKVSYKTGTSWQNRDALAIGSGHGYTVGVWIGRPDGRPTASLTGYAHAAPVLFALLSRLPEQARPRPALPRTGPLAPRPGAGLTRFGEAQDTRGHDAPRFDFPPPDATISPDAAGRVSIGVTCPQGPCDLYVNGRPAPAPDHFLPEGSGFYGLTVVDARGRSAFRQIRVLRPREGQ